MRKCKQCKQVELPPAAKCSDIVEKKGYCSVECLAEQTKVKRIAAQEKKERKRHAEAKERVKRPSDLRKEAQRSFNAFIRYRDKDQPCISCDRPISEIEGRDGWKSGGAWDAGHYMEVGSHEELRFNEDNCHRQCKSDNAGAGKYIKKKRSVDDLYRKKLVERIGIERVEALENYNEPKRYRAEDYRRIRDEYKQKLKELKSNNKNA